MAASTIAVEWSNRNELRKYPFREDCGLRPNDSAGSLIEDGWRLPNYLVVDFVLGVNGAGFNPTIYLKRMSVVGGCVTLTFADAHEEDVVTVSAVSGDVSKPISGVGSMSSARGTICFGKLERFFEETPEGLYSFSPEESMVEPTCIRPTAAGVSSISVTDASGYTTGGLVGDVKLVAGDNVHIKVIKEYNALVISADPDSGYTESCECMKAEDHVIRTINGISVDHVRIVGDGDCLDVSESDGVIRLKDTCSKPCCGCAETAFINQSINDLQSSVNTLSTNVSILDARVTSFVTSYLLARKTLS